MRPWSSIGFPSIFSAILSILSSIEPIGGQKPLSGDFYPPKVENLKEEEVVNVTFVPRWLQNVSTAVQLQIKDQEIASIEGPSTWNATENTNNLTFAIRGQFLGWTSVTLVSDGQEEVTTGEPTTLEITVVRERNMLDSVFLFSVIGLVCLAYVNMGCKLDFDVIKGVVRRPAALSVGVACQYVFMPLIAFGLGYMFEGNPGLRLSLFVTGCCPGGGASNMWALLLGGNINLSVAVTFFSTLFAFVALPAYIFTLGRVIFEVEGLHIPYENVGTLVIGLVVPVGLGLLIKRFLPRVANFLAKAIRPFFAVIILYIVTFGIYTNLYVFRLLDAQIILASVGLIWGGFLFGGIMGKCFKFPTEDCITLGLETGIQNAGVAIVLLRVSLPQPEADISLVFPIMADIVMAIPPTIALLLMTYVCKSWNPKNKSRNQWPLPSGENDSDNDGYSSKQEPLRRTAAGSEKGYQATASRY